MTEDSFVCEWFDFNEASTLATKANSRELLLSFIECYKSLPELWDATHSDYLNRNKRIKGLDRLLAIYYKIKPGATRDDVRKKINILRSNYRKELKKIYLSKRQTGLHAKNIYSPTSWVFHSLSFLRKNESHFKVEMPETEISSDATSDVMASTISISSPDRPTPPKRKARAPQPPSNQNELVNLACQYLSSQDNVMSGNEEMDVAKVWANKLRRLTPHQKLFAEKAINDVLFEAQMGNLQKDNVHINVHWPDQSTVGTSYASPPGKGASIAEHIKEYYSSSED